eukprot:6206789-Pleurochrysis_carterae.AAC.10
MMRHPITRIQLCGGLAASSSTCAAKMELEKDAELGVTDDELAAETKKVPQMMKHAGMWDNLFSRTSMGSAR